MVLCSAISCVVQQQHSMFWGLMIAVSSTVCIVSDRPRCRRRNWITPSRRLILWSSWVCWPMVKISKGVFNWFMLLRVDPFKKLFQSPAVTRSQVCPLALTAGFAMLPNQWFHHECGWPLDCLILNSMVSVSHLMDQLQWPHGVAMASLHHQWAAVSIRYMTKGRNMDRGPPTSFQSRFSMPDNIAQLMDLEGGCILASIQLAVSCSCSTLRFGDQIKGPEGFCWGIRGTLLCHQLCSAAAALHVLRMNDHHFSTVCIISDRPHSGVEDETG